MLHVQIDPHGQPLQDFYKLREHLKTSGVGFSTEHLSRLPYQQLILAATAPAGDTTVTLEDVILEKTRRRQRFLSMTDEDLTACRRYLRAEGMYDDLITERALKDTPQWDDLPARVRAWMKLDCLFNHLDDPMPRLVDLDHLLSTAAKEKEIPKEVAKEFRDRVIEVGRRHSTLSIDKLRNLIGGLAAEVREYMTEEEQAVTHPRLMRGYQCTADCFRVFTGVK